MRKILAIAATLALAVGLMVPVAGWAAYTYNTAESVVITLTVPSIKVLDMGASDNNVTFVEPTAADLDAGFVVRYAATSFIVDSNEGWSVTVTADPGYLSGDEVTTLALSNLKLKSDSKTHTIDTTLGEWTDMTTTGITVAGHSACVSDCQIVVDYKILIGWDTPTETYTTTLTYTLQ